jgi:hypothetical protein
MQKWPLRFSNFIPVHVRMETSAAEVQLGQCRNHEQTRNDGGDSIAPLFSILNTSFWGKKKLRKPLTIFNK